MRGCDSDYPPTQFDRLVATMTDEQIVQSLDAAGRVLDQSRTVCAHDWIELWGHIYGDDYTHTGMAFCSACNTVKFPDGEVYAHRSRNSSNRVSAE